MEKAKYGKMRQVNAVNGSQMVVEIGASYCRPKTGTTIGYLLSKAESCPLTTSDMP
jgi:hypothetical protein